MRRLLTFALVGFGAQLIDGSLGMAYGVTSTTLLLIAGLNPAAASASVHLAEVGTSLVSGFSHWRFGNVDWRLVLRLGVPGAAGAFLGATVLSSLASDTAAPVMAGILLAIGLFVLLRFSVRPPELTDARRSPHGRRFLSPLGLFGGFVDATGGGGWGPVSTSALLSRGKTAPRTVIGSVDASEFLVSIAASTGFLLGLGTEVLDAAVVGGLLLGGMLAAPVAAWLVTRIPPALLGTGVGGLIVLTNSRTLFAELGVDGVARWVGYGAIVVVWAVLVRVSWVRSRVTPADDASLDVVATTEHAHRDTDRAPDQVRT